MKCVVTGASGFLGSYVVKALLARGCEVAVILRGQGTLERLGDCMDKLHVISGDMMAADSYGAGLRVFKPDAVLHMAWAGVDGALRNDEIQTQNISVLRDFLRQCAQAGIKHFINAGSQAEYGPLNKRISENEPTHPTTLYGQSKLAAYNIMQQFCELHHIRFANLRIFSTYGPHDHPHWLIPSLISQLLEGKKPALTLCEQMWDYVYATDAAQAFVSVLFTPEAAGIFNVGSGSAQPLRQTVEYIRNLINPALELGFGEIAYRPDQVMHLEADSTRLQNITRWQPLVPLEKGLQQTVAWYEKRH